MDRYKLVKITTYDGKYLKVYSGLSMRIIAFMMSLTKLPSGVYTRRQIAEQLNADYKIVSTRVRELRIQNILVLVRLSKGVELLTLNTNIKINRTFDRETGN